MGLSLDQLRTPITRSEMLQFLNDELEALGFPSTSWGSGSIQRTMVLLFSRVWADMSETTKQIAEFGFNDTSSGPALSVYSKNNFDNTRSGATKTKGLFRFTSTAAVPYVVTVGQLLIATKDTAIRFGNVQAGTIPAGGTVDLQVEAIKGGSSGNISQVSELVLVTTLAGVTVVPSPASNPWYTVVGSDPESDEGLQLRNSTKWPTLSVELVRDAYINIALNANTAIRKVEVDDNNPRGEGTIDVYIAGDASALNPTGQEVQDAQNAFAQRAFQTDGFPATASTRVLVKQSNEVPLDLSGLIYVDANYSATEVLAAAKQSVRAFLKTIPLGGFTYPSPGLLVGKNDIEAAIKGTKGVKTVVLTTPAADVPVGAFGIVTEGNWSGLTTQLVI